VACHGKGKFYVYVMPEEGFAGDSDAIRTVVETHPSISLDGDMDDVDVEALDEDAELELGDEDLDALGEEKDI